MLPSSSLLTLAAPTSWPRDHYEIIVVVVVVVDRYHHRRPPTTRLKSAVFQRHFVVQGVAHLVRFGATRGIALSRPPSPSSSSSSCRRVKVSLSTTEQLSRIAAIRRCVKVSQSTTCSQGVASFSSHLFPFLQKVVAVSFPQRTEGKSTKSG